LNEEENSKEQLPVPGSPLPEIGILPVGEDPEIKQTQTPNSKFQTAEKMDVHHHSHTPDLDSHRGRKKWTHYFWEFLMSFPAVIFQLKKVSP